jgi:hypothetical protein
LGLGEFGEAGECCRGATEAAGNVEQVAGTRAGTEQGFAAGHGADEDDVGEGDGGFGEIAAGQRGFVGLG